MNRTKEYLFHEIFGLCVEVLATESGSISKRISMMLNYLSKIDWIRDIESIPEEAKDSFLHLEKYFNNELFELINSRKLTFTQKYKQSGINISGQQLEWINAELIVESMHWKTAKKIAENIFNIYQSFVNSDLDVL